MVNKITDRILKTIKSRGFYHLVIIFFVLESAWIALTAAYPEAFDEQFHFGLIKMYSHYALPFLYKQPAGASQFGAVARDPSYLYHYLMSFPYRLIELFTKDQTYQIITLRFLDIAMFAYGLVLFRKILLKTKLSKALANIAILIFALIPIVPQLAGQINYDDMLMPLVAGICLISFKAIDELRARKPTFKTTALLLILCTFTSLVKFAFLPIFLAILCFFVFYIIRYYRSNISTLYKNFVEDFRKQSLILKVALISIFLVAVGMFAERDLVNVFAYHSVDPGCSSVISVDQCKAYSAWYADYTRHQSVLSGQTKASRDIFTYSAQWLYWMWYRLFFAVNGPASNFTNYPPLPLPSAVGLLVGVAGVIAVIKYRKELFRANPYASFLVVACAFYLFALIVQGYATYQFTAVLENMNGRYLLPILLLAGALMAQAFTMAFKKHSKKLKVIVACLVVIMFLDGGGVLTYIERSNNTWYWDNSKAVKANNVAKKITKKLVVSGKNTYDTSVWFFN